VLPADLPLLLPEDVVALEKLSRDVPSAVLVPDRSGTGTNGILMRPPGLVPSLFGNNSFQRHYSAAKEAGAMVHIHHSERLMLDLDTPEDLVVYLELCKKYGETPLIELPADVLLPYVEVTHKENT
jgi:2-phospho-L-lactate guanylyltransferase